MYIYLYICMCLCIYLFIYWFIDLFNVLHGSSGLRLAQAQEQSRAFQKVKYSLTHSKQEKMKSKSTATMDDICSNHRPPHEIWQNPCNCIESLLPVPWPSVSRAISCSQIGSASATSKKYCSAWCWACGWGCCWFRRSVGWWVGTQRIESVLDSGHES